MAAVLAANKIASGALSMCGALPCMGLVSLDELGFAGRICDRVRAVLAAGGYATGPVLRVARAADSIEALRLAYRRWFWWLALGVPAFAGVIYLFYLMVPKPLPVMGG